MSDISDYQVDHLLPLVGSNPIPNVVAGTLLVAAGGTITLIHSADSFDLAQRLQSWFLRAGISDVGFSQVEEANATSISKHVNEALNNTNHTHTARVGLNYTGGTKVMSVQAYRALENWAKDKNLDAVFSYLDARSLRMHFAPAPGKPAISFYVGLSVNIQIKELLELHNWQSAVPPCTEPVLPKSAARLLAVYSNPANTEVWTKWLRHEFFRNARKQVVIPPPFWLFQSGKEIQEVLQSGGDCEVKQPAPNDKWKSKTRLQKLTVPWPDLSELKGTMSDELNQHNADYLNLAASTEKSFKNEEDFCSWLSGTWLESAVLSALQHCPQELHLQECSMDIRPKALGNEMNRELFQFDVVAMRGYQLFAFSCSTESGQESGGRGLLKTKLFEAYVRARQMGGDEARTALVCTIEQAEADKLQMEMRRDISPEGHIRVFGREQLEHLTEHITNWVREQSKES